MTKNGTLCGTDKFVILDATTDVIDFGQRLDQIERLLDRGLIDHAQAKKLAGYLLADPVMIKVKQGDA